MKQGRDVNFNLGKGFTATCWWEDTRYGFRHLCVLYKDGRSMATEKACYYNRTWECYEFQSVISRAVEKIKDYLKPSEYKALRYYIDHQREEEEKEKVLGKFSGLAAITKMAAIMAPDQKAANESRRRILEATPGISFPDDWDTLPEEEKTRRLDAVENEMIKK